MAKLSKSRFFPPAELAEPEGIVLFGGELIPEWLLDAYGHGIFPWPIFDGAPIMLWWSPDPRAIIEFDQFHVPRRLAQTCRAARFDVTLNRDFHGVITGCATAGDRQGATWLTPEMIAAYEELHRLGHAHSVETWLEGVLVGGTYGVSLGGLFSAESMFYHESDASKVALVPLVRHLQSRGYSLLDIQQLTPNTERFGAVEISRAEYLRRLADVLNANVTMGAELAPWESA